MRNVFWILILCTLVNHSLIAQISLDSTSYPGSLIGKDSLKVTTSNYAFPSLAPATPGMWDLSTVTDSVPVLFAYRVTTDSFQFADSNNFVFNIFNYQGNIQSSVSAVNFSGKSVKISRSANSIMSWTLGTSDSFIIPAQTMTYSAPHIKIAFPATYNSNWSSAYQSDLNFQLTYLLGGDTLAPGIIRSYTIEKDTVVGWGKLSVKDVGGSPSPFLNVLQVKTIITQVDSYFLKGVPFTNTMLTFFGVSQGQKDTIYEQNYYRSQEVTPLAKVEFRDAAYTQPYKATTHVQRLQNVGVATQTQEEGIRVYPNPVTNGLLHIDLPPGASDGEYELMDMNGKKIKSGKLQSGSACLSLPNLSAGIYFLKILRQGAQEYITPLEIGN